MITLMFALLMSVGVDLDARELRQCAEVREALRRADISLKYVALTLRVPIQKLSDQLNGKARFTYFCRFAQLPNTFQDALDEVRTQARGALVIDTPEMVSLLEAVKMLGRQLHARRAHEHDDERMVG